jgi:SAM-dependent methyltransferase
MRWPRRRRPGGGRLPSLGQDYTEGHRRYVGRLGASGEQWLRTKPFSVPPGYELRECLRTFVHVVDQMELDVRAQVLDVGCGPGWLSEFLARCGYWVTGIDVSEDMVNVARERIAAIDKPVGEGVEALAEFHAMPASEIPWTERFDAAILYDAMHHLDDEVETLRVIRRSLVPGGRIFIHEGVRPEPGSEGERQLVAEMEEYGTLESPFDPEYLVSVLEKAAFTHVTRFVAVDELLDVSARDEALRRVESLLRYPPMNTVVAQAPVPAGFAPDGRRYAARIETRTSGVATSIGRELAVPITITNTGSAFWPTGDGSSFPHGAVGLGTYIELNGGERAEFPRQALPRSVSPGESVDIEVRVPRASIQGRNEVEIDLVREGIAWFSHYGSTPLRVPLTVGD